MPAKSRKMFMALVGAYLVYTGVNLVRSVLQSHPNYMQVYVVLGVVFAVFGIVTIGMNLKAYIEESKREAEEGAAKDGETGSKDVLDAEDAVNLEEEIDLEEKIDPEDVLDSEEEENHEGMLDSEDAVNLKEDAVDLKEDADLEEEIHPEKITESESELESEDAMDLEEEEEEK